MPDLVGSLVGSLVQNSGQYDNLDNGTVSKDGTLQRASWLESLEKAVGVGVQIYSAATGTGVSPTAPAGAKPPVTKPDVPTTTPISRNWLLAGIAAAVLGLVLVFRK
jgi:hypothetical protein